MRNNTKKIFLTVLSTIMLTACGSKNDEPVEPNVNRGTDYTYDFFDYVDINVYGPEGSAVLLVTPKDFSVKDFDSEQEYIKVRKLVDAVNPTYIPGYSDTKNYSGPDSYLFSNANSDLSNDQIIQLYIGDKFKRDDYISDLSINLEPFEYQVDGLDEGTDLDLYDDKLVTFFVTQGTSNLYYHINPKSTSVPQEIKDHIAYEISSDSQDFIPGETILNVSSTLDEDFLQSNNNEFGHPYYSTKLYMLMHDFNVQQESQTVLDAIATPVNFEEGGSNAARSALNDEFLAKKTTFTYQGVDYTISDLANLEQEATTYKDDDLYNYLLVVMAQDADGNEVLADINVSLCQLEDDVILLDYKDINILRDGYKDVPVNSNYKIVAQYYYDAPTPTPEITAEPTAEALNEETTENADTQTTETEVTVTPSPEPDSTVSPESN